MHNMPGLEDTSDLKLDAALNAAAACEKKADTEDNEYAFERECADDELAEDRVTL